MRDYYSTCDIERVIILIFIIIKNRSTHRLKNKKITNYKFFFCTFELQCSQ